MGRIIGDIRRAVDRTEAAPGDVREPRGQFQAQEEATKLIAALSLMSLVMVFLVLYSRYKSATLAALVMANIPLALVGSVVAMVAGVTLSVASMVRVSMPERLGGGVRPNV